MRTRCFGALALALAGALTMSCGGFIDPSTNQVETFTDTITKGGLSHGFPFTVSKTGEFTVKITALAPSSSVVMGALYGDAQSDGSCPANPQSAYQQNNSVLRQRSGALPARSSPAGIAFTSTTPPPP